MPWDTPTAGQSSKPLKDGACPGYLQHLLRVNKNIANCFWKFSQLRLTKRDDL